MKPPEALSAATTAPFGHADEGRDGGLARRRFLAVAAVAMGLAAAGCAAAPPRHGPRLQLTLRPPSGPYPVGTVSLRLVDRTRLDPWLDVPRPRELMVSVWYPALDDRRRPWAAWIQPAAGKLFLARLIPSDATAASPATPAPRISLDGVRLPVTRARQGAPADPSARRCPVVLYSPGYGNDRELGTGLVSDLASRGYVVVTTDYTYEAAEVEFPGGRVEVSIDPDIPGALTTRISDTRFVLDELTAWNGAAARSPLPAGLAGALDLTRVGMFGHSLGGATAADAMAADGRILAGIDLDGSIIVRELPSPGDPASLAEVKRLAGAVAKKVGSRPFMIVTHAGYGPHNDPSLQAFWANLSGWRRLLGLADSGHYTFTDDEVFLSQLAEAKIIPKNLARQVVIPAIGTIDPARAISAERAYIAAFFDLHLRHRPSSLLDHPSPLYPEIQFIAT